ncbi:MAG: hypothetical protein AB7U82_30355 [Blastocatellales bacterium]
MSAIPWLEQHAPGFSGLSATERSLLTDFALLWSLFEGEVLKAAASVNTIEQTVQRWNQAGLLLPQTFAAAADYFKERYFAEGVFTYRFDHLHLDRSGNPQVVRNVLSGQDAAPESIASALLIIVYRYRCNLFHGEKWTYQLQEQEQNFSHANEVLMRAVELNRRVQQNVPGLSE